MRPDGPRDPVVGPENGPEPPFPLRLDGKVIKGFGRGSKELGIPTANIPIEGLTVGGKQDVESGVYYGWAGISPSSATGQSTTTSKAHHAGSEIADALTSVVAGGATEEKEEERETATSDKGAVYPMVMSIGWNPYYKNEKRSVEVHVMHQFEKDFYGSHMNLCILGFIRPEYDYVSKESLIEDIREDIAVAGRCLERPAYASYREDGYLLDFKGKGDVAH